MLRKAILFFLFWLSICEISISSDIHVPNLEFYTAQGEKLSFKNLQGKVILINFFASYCPSCQVELSEFSELYRKFRLKGLEIISFIVDRGGEYLLPQIIESRGIEYYMAVADETILSAFGWPDILPTTFVVDRHGLIVDKIIGYTPKKRLENELISLLGKTHE